LIIPRRKIIMMVNTEQKRITSFPLKSQGFDVADDLVVHTSVFLGL
jgi:hypothetical protein